MRNLSILFCNCWLAIGFCILISYVYNNINLTMKGLLLLVLLIAIGYSQVSPVWSQTPRIDTADVILVNSGIATTNWTTTWTTTYSLGTVFSANPYVGLSIRQLRIASNSAQIGVLSYLNGMPTTTSFVHRVDIFSPTSVWYLKVRYIAYDGAFSQFTDIQLMYKLYDNANGDFTNINANAGTVRTDSLATGLTATSPSTHTNIAVAFTAGFRGTISGTFFQANISEVIPANGQLRLSVTVASDTLITKLSFYIFLVDITNLLTRCWIFVESAITKSTYGVQTTFFTPKYVNFNRNYISGLRSFSISDNLQYNFTVNGLNFTTYSNSYYNDAGHMNFWARSCPSPYTLFNQVDYMCYTDCPAGTYLIVADSLCVACDYTCATCLTGTTCSTCPVNRVLNNATGLCDCVDYFYELNKVCIACHYSCQKCVYSGQYFNCMACDPATHRSPLLPNNSACTCDSGFTDVGTAICKDICGDGKVNSDLCDDGNVADYDGCSSTCSTQQYFTCVNPTPPAVTPASSCYFTGDISIIVTRIEKDPESNIATFYLNITPFVNVFSQLSESNLDTNITGVKYIKSGVYNSLVTYTVSYTADFEGKTIMFGIKPSSSGILSRFYAKNATFTANGYNGLLLQAYSDTDYSLGTQIQTASYIIGFLFSAFGILFCFGDWKQLGLQLFFSVQLCFMTFVILPNHDPIITKMMYIRNVMGWNGQIPMQIPPYPVAVLEQMQYSVPYINNFNIMVVFPGAALLLYLAYRGALYRHQKLRLQGEVSKEFEQVTHGKILKYFKFDLFVYFMLFNMQQILFSTVVQTQYIQNGAIFAYIVLCLIGIVVCIVALFAKPVSMKAYRQILFHKSYGNKTFLFVLISILVMDLFLLLSVLVNTYIFYVMFALPAAMTVYLIAQRPFKTVFNNIRLIVIQCCLITVFALQVVILSTTYQVHKIYPIGILCCMGIIFLVTFIAWIIDIVKKICKMRSGQEYQKSSKSSQKQEQSINQKVREAGFALVNSNLNGTRMPIAYEMGDVPASSRKKDIDALRSPRKANQSKYDEQTTYKNSRVKPKKQPESQFKTNQKQSKQKQKSNVKNGNDDVLRLRQDTQQKMNEAAPSSRRKLNPYQQILQQTASRYK